MTMPPASARQIGDMLHSDVGTLRIWDGTRWVPVTPPLPAVEESDYFTNNCPCGHSWDRHHLSHGACGGCECGDCWVVGQGPCELFEAGQSFASSSSSSL